MERDEWNAVWSDEGEGSAASRHGHDAPDGLLVGAVAGLSPGRALDLGCGVGANVVWLAQQGWEATGVDISDVAVDKARQRAAEAGASAVFEAADLRTYAPTRAFDLVTLFYVHLPAEERRAVLAQAAAMLAPGGRLLFIGHDKSDKTWVEQHLSGHGQGHGHGHGHGQRHETGHGHGHGHDAPDPGAVASMLARLTTPQEVAAELPALVIERAEVVQHDAHHSSEHAGTTLVLARRP